MRLFPWKVWLKKVLRPRVIIRSNAEVGLTSGPNAAFAGGTTASSTFAIMPGLATGSAALGSGGVNDSSLRAGGRVNG